MQITLDKKIQSKVKVASKKMGLNEKDFINRSVLAYLNEFKNAISLKKELDMWDTLSALSIQNNNF